MRTRRRARHRACALVLSPLPFRVGGRTAGGCPAEVALRPVPPPLTHAFSPSFLSRSSCRDLPAPPSRGRSEGTPPTWQQPRRLLPLRRRAVSDSTGRGRGGAVGAALLPLQRGEDVCAGFPNFNDFTTLRHALSKEFCLGQKGVACSNVKLVFCGRSGR